MLAASETVNDSVSDQSQDNEKENSHVIIDIVKNIDSELRNRKHVSKAKARNIRCSVLLHQTYVLMVCEHGTYALKSSYDAENLRYRATFL